MNATPTQITVSIGFSNRFSVEALNEFYEGIYAACEKYNVDLIGGDTSSSQKGFIISVTALGEVAPDTFVTRAGAQKGDLLCVTGDLGAAFLGLSLLEREKKIFIESPGVQPDLEQQNYLVGRLLKPEARKDMVDWFAQKEVIPTAMMDISDGLSSEVLHICKQSICGAVVFEDKLPIHDDTKNFCYKVELDPTATALSGGEDYELLFTVKQDDYEKIKDHKDIAIIGYITEPEKKVTLLTKGGNMHELVAQGWKHL
jgi:thiamine-monophosphate kinase